MNNHKISDRYLGSLGQRGITGLETAIVLIAFVVVASVFAFAVITVGLFSSEEATSSASAGVDAAQSTMLPKGSMILEGARSTGSPSIAGTPTLMTDGANGAFIAEGVKIGDTIKNVTDNSSGIVTALTATTISSSPLSGGTLNTWAATDTYEIKMDSISTIKFKVTPSPGAQPFSLDQTTTVLAFNDFNNAQNGTYLATLPFGGGADPFPTANTVYWTHSWLVGSGPAIGLGDIVEFTVNIKNLTVPLAVNSSFSIEIIPQTGLALSVSGTTPLAFVKVMDLN